MGSVWVGIGAVSAFFGVALGAFGAHGLSGRLDTRAMEIYETAVKYQMYHALALIAFGLWLARAGEGASALPGWGFTAGTVLFSGSLYALSLSGIKMLGAVTPLGGIAFLLAWGAFAWQAFR